MKIEITIGKVRLSVTENIATHNYSSFVNSDNGNERLTSALERLVRTCAEVHGCFNDRPEGIKVIETIDRQSLAAMQEVVDLKSETALSSE